MTDARSVFSPEGGDIMRPHTRPLAIVGSHPNGIKKVPWGDSNVEIWLFNEAPMKPGKYPRWDALLQIHTQEVYTSTQNWVNSGYWEWLQQDHGKTIFLQHADLRVPNSVEYPLDKILEMIPYRYLRSSPAMALALAIYLGYQDVSLYGVELASNTEYAYQATNFAFWIGFAHGKGIDLHLECWEQEFNQRIYGYEGELQLGKDHFQERAAELDQAIFEKRNTAQQLESKLDDAILAGNAQKVADLSLTMDRFFVNSGTADSIKEEAVRYANRNDIISRQEFERRAAEAQRDGDKLRTQRDHLNGIVEYTWNAWNSTRSSESLKSFKHFLDQRNATAYSMGKMLGKFQENIAYMKAYDDRLTAAGGIRALGRDQTQ